MQRPGLRLFEIFDNYVAFKKHLVANLEQWHFARGRNCLEPFGLVSEIDIDALKGNVLFGQNDGRPLHIGAEIE